MFRRRPTITAGMQATGLTIMFSQNVLRFQRFGFPTTPTSDRKSDLALAPYPATLASHRLELWLFWLSGSTFLAAPLLVLLKYDASRDDVCWSSGVVSPWHSPSPP